MITTKPPISSISGILLKIIVCRLISKKDCWPVMQRQMSRRCTHGLAALLFSSIDAEDVSFLEKRGPTSHLTRESTAGHWLFQTVRLDYPYEGAVLLWHLSRSFSSLLGAGAVLMTYFMALELFPGKKTRALTAAALLAFIPRFVFMSSTLNDDNILALVMAIYLFLMVSLIKGYSSWLYLAGIGLMLGLAITAKISSILVPLTTILLVCFLAWRQQWSLAIFVKRIAIIVLFAFLVSSWWFGFVIWQFGDFENRGLVGGAINAIVPEVVSNASNVDLLSAIQGAEVAIEKRGQESFGEWLSYFGKSFWEARLVIWPNQFLLSGYAAWLIWGLAGLIGVGIIGTWWKGDEFKRIWIGFFLLHILAFLPFMLIRHYLNGFVQETAQGRHVLMPAGAAVGILLMVGWSYWTGTRRRYWLGPILPALFLFWSVTQLYFIYHLFPKSLPVSTEETTRGSSTASSGFSKPNVV